MNSAPSIDDIIGGMITSVRCNTCLAILHASDATPDQIEKVREFNEMVDTVLEGKGSRDSPLMRVIRDHVFAHADKSVSAS